MKVEGWPVELKKDDPPATPWRKGDAPEAAPCRKDEPPDVVPWRKDPVLAAAPRKPLPAWEPGEYFANPLPMPVWDGVDERKVPSAVGWPKTWVGWGVVLVKPGYIPDWPGIDPPS